MWLKARALQPPWGEERVLRWCERPWRCPLHPQASLRWTQQEQATAPLGAAKKHAPSPPPKDPRPARTPSGSRPFRAAASSPRGTCSSYSRWISRQRSPPPASPPSPLPPPSCNACLEVSETGAGRGWIFWSIYRSLWNRLTEEHWSILRHPREKLKRQLFLGGGKHERRMMVPDK